MADNVIPLLTREAALNLAYAAMREAIRDLQYCASRFEQGDDPFGGQCARAYEAKLSAAAEEVKSLVTEIID